MTVEVMAIVISAAGILVALGIGLFAGFAWMLRRMDDKFDKIDARFGKVYAKFDTVYAKFDAVHDNFGKISAQIGELRTELNA
ncbi:hypothetical protein [Enteractinococcus helveticum]|uniref:hypothetical protein n=1 Tax=Enteractinococcus helveticum TaxID=1837282 RepID=UPI000A81D500|nr:hypothetical protein [Enteractinococcus helveticum]